MKLFAFFAASASAMSVGSDRPCDAKIEECLRMGNCFDLPFCEPETGNFVTGPVCGYDNTCACIDAQTGEQSVSNEGVLLVSGVGLPQDFFGGWMRDSDFNCDKFSSDATSSPSLLGMGIPEDVISQIAGLE